MTFIPLLTVGATFLWRLLCPDPTLSGCYFVQRLLCPRLLCPRSLRIFRLHFYQTVYKEILHLYNFKSCNQKWARDSPTEVTWLLINKPVFSFVRGIQAFLFGGGKIFKGVGNFLGGNFFYVPPQNFLPQR